MLLVLPFLVMAITFFSVRFLEQPVRAVEVKGIIDITFVNHLSNFWLWLTGFVAVMGIAYMIFGINERFKLLHQTTTLPSLIYVLLTSGIMVNRGGSGLLVSVLLVTFAIERLQTAINDTKSNQSLFDFGVLITLAVSIYPKFVLLIAWALCVLFFSGRSTLKDIMALLTGLITPLLVLIFYYFWTDRLPLLPTIFIQNLLLGEYIHQLPVIEIVRLGLLLFLLLVSLYQLSIRYAVLIVSHRRGILSLVSLMVFSSLTLFIIPGSYYDFMYMLALPLSFLYALYFLTNRMIVWGNLMFMLLLGACFLTYLI